MVNSDSERDLFLCYNPTYKYYYTSVGIYNEGDVLATQRFEEEIRAKWWKINPGDVVLDIGAAFGSYTLSALSMGAEIVIAAEPGKDEFINLSSNLLLNSGYINHCAVLPVLVVDNKNKELKYCSKSHSVVSENDAENRIQTTLTDLVYYFGLSKVDWIKIDVEGFEDKVLIGGEEILEKFSPKLLIENHIGFVSNIKELINDILIPLNYKEIDNIVGNAGNDNWSLWDKFVTVDNLD